MTAKQIISFALACCMAILIMPTCLAQATTKEQEEISYYLGDVTLDGIINTGDATQILKFCSDMVDFTDEQNLRADANNDTTVNTADAVYVLKVVAGTEEAIAVTKPVTDIYNVSYINKLEGVSIELPAPASVKEGETYTVAVTGIADVTVEGSYVFKGWRASHNGIIYNEGDSFLMPGNDVELEATWAIESNPTPSEVPTDKPTPVPTQEPTPEPTALPTPVVTQTPVPTAQPGDKLLLIVGKYPTTETANIKINGEETTNGKYDYGTDITISFTGNTLDFGAWLVNGEVVSKESTYSFTLKSQTSVVASFMTDTQVTVWSGGANGNFSGGNGTQSNPYIITTAEQLAYLAGIPKVQNFYKLGNDIYLNSNVLEKVAKGNTSGLKVWSPIGTDSNSRFYGFFDGAGYTVYGLYITNSPTYGGLFGITGGGTNYGGINYKNYAQIKNLTVADAYIAGESAFMGGVICSHQAYGHLENLTFYGKIVNKYKYASENALTGTGGIVANVETYACEIRNCRSYGEITTAYDGQMYGTSGIVGQGNNVWLTVKGCENHATLNCYRGGAGGIIGYSGTANKIENCANYGNIYHQATGYALVGGIVGHERAGDSYVGTAYIQGCSNHGNIYGKGICIGGILGYGYSYNFSANGHILSVVGCYNLGTVRSDNTNAYMPLGGIVGAGRHVSIANCYNAGSIESGKESGAYYGSLIGVADAGSTQPLMSSYSNCYSFSGDCKATYNVTAGTVLQESDIPTLAVRLGEKYFKNDYDGINNGYALTINEPRTEAPSLTIGKSFAIAYVIAFVDGENLVAFEVCVCDDIIIVPNNSNDGFSGWLYNGRVYKQGEAFKVSNCDAVFYAVY